MNFFSSLYVVYTTTKLVSICMKYPLEDCIGSRMRSMSRKIDGIYRKHLGNSGITENQLSILMALYKTGTIEQNFIGNYLNLEKSSLSRNLVRLIQAGYINKEGAVNRPSIGLTQEGKEKVNELTPLWENAMDEIYFILKNDDLEAFRQFESKINTL